MSGRGKRSEEKGERDGEEKRGEKRPFFEIDLRQKKFNSKKDCKKTKKNLESSTWKYFC